MNEFILGLDHVQLSMPPDGEVLAQAFYEGILGIPRVPKPPKAGRREGSWFESSHVAIHLGIEEDFHPARRAHPALRVADYDGLMMVLAGAGILVTPAESLGTRRCHIADPFANRIELIEVLPTN